MKFNKRVVAIVLMVTIVTGCIQYRTVQVQAVGVVAYGAEAIWAVITGVATGAAGYNVTKKQNNTIVKSNQDCLNLFEAINNECNDWDAITDRAAYLTFVTSTSTYLGMNSIQQKIIYEFCKYMWSQAEIEDKFNEGVATIYCKLAYDLITQKNKIGSGLSPQDDDDDEGNDKWDIKIVSGIAKGITVGTSFLAAISKLSELKITEDLNAEYEKAKSMYDWEYLGFKTDMDTFKTVPVDYISGKYGLEETSSRYYYMSASAFRQGFSNGATVWIEDKSVCNYGTTGIYIQNAYMTKGVAFLTFHDYVNDNWITGFYRQDRVYEKLLAYKNGELSYSDLVNYFSVKDESVDNIGASVGFIDIIPKNFYGYSQFYNTQNTYYRINISKSPFCMNMNDWDSSNSGNLVLNSTNCWIVNPGKNFAYFYLNYQDADTCTLSTNSINGDIVPVVAKSKITNLESELSTKDSIVVDPNDGITTDTDSYIQEDVAPENDLELQIDDSVDVDEDTGNFLTRIINQIKKLPAKIYAFFTSPLGRIITLLTNILEAVRGIPGGTGVNPISAIQSFANMVENNYTGIFQNLRNLPSYIWNEFSSVLTNIMSAVQSIPNLIPGATAITQPIIDFLTNPLASIQSALSALADAIPLPASITQPIINFFNPDTVAFDNAVSDVKNKFGWVGDVKANIGAVYEILNIEPRNYIDVSDWGLSADSDGEKITRISFAWYDPYRPYVNSILTAIIYLVAIWRLLVNLPSHIRGLSSGTWIIGADSNQDDSKNGG